MPEEPKDNEKEVIKARTFNLTRFVSVLAAAVTSIGAAGVALLETVGDQPVGATIAIFGVVAAALLGASLVMAVDIAARAYVTGAGSATKGDPAKGDPASGSAPSALVAAPPGTRVWLNGDDGAHPLLAISLEGEKSKYLVAKGPPTRIPPGGLGVYGLDEAPTWHEGSEIRAVKPAKWKP